ncbi:MAG: phosphotransferase [Cyanobacteria bacterium SZAS TMP-1]|nr:phosphotransferase [Cyanobacteria bacterium SZAS TMP-1]
MRESFLPEWFPISPDRFAGLLAAFQLKACGEPALIKRDLRSTVFRQNCGRELVFKCVRAEVIQGDPALTARLEQLLITCQAEIPARLLTSEGAACWHCDEDGSIWIVSQFTPGTTFQWLSPTWNDNDAHAAGQLLARLHCAGRLAAEQLTSAERTVLGSILPSLADETFTRRQLAAGSLLAPVEIDTVSRLVTTAAAALLLMDLPTAIVHGDYHPGNVLFRDGQAIAAIDFDYAHLEHPLYDLAYSWLTFSPGNGLLTGYRQHLSKTGEAPEVYLTADDADFDSPSRSAPLHHYSVVAAYLLLLWATSADGRSHPQGDGLARRMIGRLQKLA